LVIGYWLLVIGYWLLVLVFAVTHLNNNYIYDRKY